MIEQQEMAALAANYVNTTNRHIFLTGKAGTGKTTFLRYIADHTYKNAVIAAPTGIAAINAGGVTLHSLLQLPFGTFLPERTSLTSSHSRINTPQTLFKETKFNASKRKLIQELELLIIDEVSMLRADLLDCIDHTLRYLRKKKHVPFGGLQLLFIGDLMQLPPVVKDQEADLLRSYYPSPYFFEAYALKENPPIRVELQKIFRQSDQDFIDLLNRLRHNEQTDEDITSLNRFYNPYFEQSEETGYIHLTTHNYRADKLNQSKLQQLESELFSFPAEIGGDFPENMYPTEAELHLKAGAQVMFIKNDPSGEGAYFNGKIGMVSTLSDEEIWVKFEDGDEVKVSPYQWENKRFLLDAVTNEVDEKLLGTFQQYPIKLAWAVTVHKSQGLTFEKAILDLSGTFAPGQLYVALSRLTSLKGLVLSSPLPENPPSIEESLQAFIGSFEETEQLKEGLEEDRKYFIQQLSEEVFDFSKLISEVRYHESSFNKDENRSLKQQYLPWTQDFISEVLPLQSTGAGFIKQVKKILSQSPYLPYLSERMQAAEKYFVDIIGEHARKLASHRASLKRETKVKAYRKELQKLEDLFIQYNRKITKLVLLVKHAAQNKVLSKKDLHNSSFFQSLQERNSTAGKQKEKTPTAEVSFNLLKQGKSIREIADERGLVTGTIEGHLASYVEAGHLDVHDLLTKQRISQITDKYNEGLTSSSSLKAELPNDISYGEIKLVLAYLRSMEAANS